MFQIRICGIRYYLGLPDPLVSLRIRILPCTLEGAERTEINAFKIKFIHFFLEKRRAWFRVRYRSADPDPYENVSFPEYWFLWSIPINLQKSRHHFTEFLVQGTVLGKYGKVGGCPPWGGCPTWGGSGLWGWEHETAGLRDGCVTWGKIWSVRLGAWAGWAGDGCVTWGKIWSVRLGAWDGWAEGRLSYLGEDLVCEAGSMRRLGWGTVVLPGGGSGLWGWEHEAAGLRDGCVTWGRIWSVRLGAWVGWAGDGCVTWGKIWSVRLGAWDGWAGGARAGAGGGAWRDCCSGPARRSAAFVVVLAPAQHNG